MPLTLEATYELVDNPFNRYVLVMFFVVTIVRDGWNKIPSFLLELSDPNYFYLSGSKLCSEARC